MSEDETPAAPPPTPAPAPQGEEAQESWPDTLGFWIAITFAAIAVPVLICGGGLGLLRRLF